MALKLSTLDPTIHADVAQKLVLLHPSTGDVLVDDSGNECGIYLFGTDSRAYKAVQARQTDAMLAQVSAIGSMKQITEASAKADQIELLVAATKDWYNLSVDDSGEPTPFSVEAAAKLYRQNPWIVEQAERFIKNRRNYFRDSAGGAAGAL